MCVQSTKKKCKYNLKVIYCLRQFLLVANGNHTNRVQSCAKFDAHAHYHYQVVNNNRYYLGLLTVAMATIVVGCTSVLRSMVIAIFYLLQT